LKKILTALSLILVCSIVFTASGTIEGCHAQLSMSDMTAGYKTDRIIGKYTDPDTGAEEYIPVNANDVIEFGYSPFAGSEKKIYFKCYNGTDGSISEMEYIQPDYIRHICSEPDGELAANAGRDWGIKRISSDSFAQKLSEKLANRKDSITVAVVDTGTDLKHSLLRGRLVKGYDFVDGDNDPSNKNNDEEHGTHVSGIIAASSPDNVKIMPVRVLDNDGGYDYDISQGILYAVKSGADVINLSLGGPGYSPLMDIAINYALSKNIIIVASAGNDALDTKTMFPAQKKEIIVVSAANKDDDIALFSNYGDSVDVCAPGEDIYSSVPGDKYISADGTSMSAPFVSSICAMLKLEDNGRSIADVENILKTYTDDIGTPGWDKAFGEGIINMDSYFSEKSDFRLISPTKKSSYCDGVSVKYFVKNKVGATVSFYIDNSLRKKIVVKKDGYDTQTVNLKGVREGEHTLRVELTTADGIKSTESIGITKLVYNTSFELLDINNERVEGPLVYLYWMKDGRSGYLEVEDKKIQDNIVYMNLDMDSLLDKYDKIIATASSDHYHSDNLDAPIYIKNIVSAGRKTFSPNSVQSIRVYEEIPFDLYGDRFSIPHNQVMVTPFIDGHYINMILPIAKNYPGSSEFYIEQGAHKVTVMTPNYKSVVQLDGYGLNEVLLSERKNTKITVVGIKGTNGDDDKNKFFYHIQKRGILNITVLNGYTNEEDRSEYVGDGNYVATMYREVDGNIVCFKRYFSLDAAKSRRFNLLAGGLITNKFIVDYSGSAMNVYLYFQDSYDNIVHNFSLKHGDGSIRLEPGVILKGKGNSFIGSVIQANIPGIDAYGYTFSGQNIPDGDYTLQVKLESPIPIYKSQLTDMPVKIKGGRFVLPKSNSKPQAVEQTVLATVNKFDTVVLNLKDLFKDADTDKLYYRVNKGYVHNDMFYLETSNVGIQEVKITALDYKGGSAAIQLYVLSTDGLIFCLPEPGQDELISLNGASVDVVGELLDAYNNNLIISKIADSYGQSITREEFCELLMNFYYQAGGKEITKLLKNPFKDTKNPDVLKLYSIGAIKGAGAGRFAPKDSITYLQATDAIAAVVKYLKPDADLKNSGDKIDPKAPVSRESALVMVNRTYNEFFKVNDKER